MKDFFERPEVFVEAREAKTPKKEGKKYGWPLIVELLVFVVVFIVASLVQAFLGIPGMMVAKTMDGLLEAEISENLTIINGGAFGLEGGIAVTIVLLVGIVLMSLPRKNDKKATTVIETLSIE